MNPEYSFDFLEKVDYASVLQSVFCRMDAKVKEAKLKRPEPDYSEQEKMIDDLRKIYIWVSALFEEKELLLRRNIDMERVLLEVKEKITRAEKELKVQTELNKF